MAVPRPLPLGPMAGAVALTAALLGTAAWHVHLQSLQARVEERRGALKRLLINARIPPNEAVASYVKTREASLERAYQQSLARAVASPPPTAAAADPQLHFQERLHDVQRTLERLATARRMAVPEILGFPKDLPPSDTVPRLLVQLALIEQAAALILEQGVEAVASFKIEDPEPVAIAAAGAFLTRVPVRVRFSGALPSVVKALEALGRTTPLIDVRLARVAASSSPDLLDAELVIVQYLADPNARNRDE